MFTDAKAKVDQADAADPSGGLQAAGEAIAKLTEFSSPLKDLHASPELLEAAERRRSASSSRPWRRLPCADHVWRRFPAR